MRESEFLMQTVTPADVAAGLGVSERAVYDWAQKGELNAEQGANGRWTIRVQDCHEYIANMKRRIDKEALRAQFDAVVKNRMLPAEIPPCAS